MKFKLVSDSDGKFYKKGRYYICTAAIKKALGFTPDEIGIDIAEDHEHLLIHTQMRVTTIQPIRLRVDGMRNVRWSFKCKGLPRGHLFGHLDNLVIKRLNINLQSSNGWSRLVEPTETKTYLMAICYNA